MKRYTTKSKIVAFAICVLLLTVFAGCHGARTVDEPEPPPTAVNPSGPGEEPGEEPGESLHPTISIPGISADNYPRIDGSTANLPLMAKLYSGICGVSEEEAETMVSVSGGTGEAWRSMVWDNADLLIVYEAPDGVMEELKNNGIEVDVRPIGRDGLVFLVNKANPVEGLTTKQLQDIYTGKATDWKDVGGEPGPIVAYQRNEQSGSQTLFLKLLMKGLKPMQAPTELVPGMMSGLIEAVAGFNSDGGAIGYSVFYYADLMYANPDIKILSVDGVTPSNGTIGSGDYPFVNDFYVVIRANDPEDSPARILRDWLLSDEGAALMREANYVPIG